MRIKFNNVKTLMKYTIPDPNDIEFEECKLFVYTKCLMLSITMLKMIMYI